MSNQSHSIYRWYALAVSALSMAFVVMVPESCMSVLFKEISRDLDLTLLQIGTIWGMLPLGSIGFLIVGGVLCDRYGVKRVVTVSCFIAGIFGALRGLSNGFSFLVTMSLMVGLVTAIVPIGAVKLNQILFSNRGLGIANGIMTAGYGVGSTIASMISATLLSPLLGGWRNVLFLYAGVVFIISMLWWFTIRDTQPDYQSNTQNKESIFQSISQVIHIPSVWWISLVLMAQWGSIMSLQGYLPFYLRDCGWPSIHADSALTLNFLIGTSTVIPLSILSDRLGQRKKFLIPSMIICVVCIYLLSIFNNVLVWGIVFVLGFFSTSISAILLTMFVEVVGNESKNMGIAVGVLYTMGRLGIFIASPIGNSLARFNPGTPYVFWSMLCLLGVVILSFIVKEPRLGAVRQ